MKPSNKRKRRRIRTVVIPKPVVTDVDENGNRIIDMDAAREARWRENQLSELKGGFQETVERRMLRNSVTERVAKTQEEGHPIGRLARQMKWNNEVASQRIAAGFRFAEIVTEYRKDVLSSPNPNPRGQDMNRVGGLSTREVTQERARKLANDFMAIHGAIGAVGNPGYLFRLLDMTCCEDCSTDNWGPQQVGDLIRALDAIGTI